MAPEPPPSDPEATVVLADALATDERERAVTVNRDIQRRFRQSIPDQWDVARGRAKRRR